MDVFVEETSQPEFGQFFRDVTSLLKEKTGETGEIYVQAEFKESKGGKLEDYKNLDEGE